METKEVGAASDNSNAVPASLSVRASVAAQKTLIAYAKRHGKTVAMYRPVNSTHWFRTTIREAADMLKGGEAVLA